MSTTIKISMEDLSAALRKDAEKRLELFEIAQRRAAHRLVSHLVQLTDDLGITYLGTYKAHFHVVERDGKISVDNDAPHAGLVENGARPHEVSLEGRAAIKVWCMRKLGLDEKEAERATWAICEKIKKVGQAPRYVMRQSIQRAREFLKDRKSVV